MTDTSAAPAVTETPVKPESWTDQAWDLLQEAEQWLVNDLHELGYIFSHDIWPILKVTFQLFFSQEFAAIFAAVSANFADPALMGAAVGSAVLLTATTAGVADATNALQSAITAVKADPSVQAFVAGN